MLARYGRREPDKLAIVDLDQNTSISYGALERAVTDIAAALKQRGIGKGGRVLLLADETLEKLLVWLAVWRLAAVVAVLNVELNARLIADLAAVVDPALALVHKELDGDELLAGKPFVRFGRYSESAGGADPQDDFFSTMARGIAPESLPERNAAADLACIFCTSGTTSRPKLVVYDHCAYWLNGLSSLEALGLSDDDRTLEYRSFGWNSAQVVSLMPFLESGLTMHIARRFSHSRFFEWIRTYGITYAVGVPTVINMLLNKPLGYTAKDVPTLRLMSCSTAPLTREQWMRFEQMYGVKLLQMYGMSEAGWICCNRHYRSKMGTVGVPALHQEFEIIDPEGQPCPPNVEGEVTVGGPHCAVGYLLDDGAIDLIRGRRIKSGDLAIMDEDGFVRVSGRTKDLDHSRRRERRAARDRRGAAQASPDRRCRGRRRARQGLRRRGDLLRGGARRQRPDRSGGARALPGPPAQRKSAEAGLHGRGTAEKRPRQGLARQAQGGLERTDQAVGVSEPSTSWSPASHSGRRDREV